VIFNCPVCGKKTEAMWPEQWRYKYNGKHICSWGCLRKLQKKDEAKTAAYYRSDETDGEEDDPMRKITLEQKKKAVQIAISGGDPLEHLKKCGSEAPDKLWYYIKNRLKVTDPELYAQIPDMRKKETKKEPEPEAPAENPEEPKTLDGSAWEPYQVDRTEKKQAEEPEKKPEDLPEEIKKAFQSEYMDPIRVMIVPLVEEMEAEVIRIGRQLNVEIDRHKLIEVLTQDKERYREAERRGFRRGYMMAMKHIEEMEEGENGHD